MASWNLKEKSSGELTLVIEGEKWEKAVKKAFQKLAAKVTLPGFRKGQAPKALLEKKISEQERYFEAIQENANTWLKEALDAEKLEPISQPKLDIKQMDALKAELVFLFAIKPEAKVTNYEGLEYPLEKSSVTKKEIKEEAAAEGDIVNIDYEGFKDDKAFDGGKANSYDLTLGSHAFIPGFEEQLIGLKAGDEKEVKLSFPKDYHVADLAGAPVVFKVKVNQVKVKKLPEVNDDFAQDVNAPGVENVEQLNKMIEDRLLTSKKNRAEEKAEAALMDALLKNTEVDLPDVMVDDEVQNQVNQLAAQIKQYGMELNAYLKMMGQTLESIKDSYRLNAVKTVTMRLALEAVAKKANINPSDEDIEKEYSDIAKQYSISVEQVKKAISKELLIKDVANKLAYDLIKEKAIKVTPKSKEKSSKSKTEKSSKTKEEKSGN